MFEAVGRPDISTKLALPTTLTLAALIYPMTLWWGITGAALAMLVSTTLFAPVYLMRALNLLSCPVISYSKAMLAPSLCAGIMVGVLYLAEQVVFTEPTLLGLINLVAMGAITFAITSFLVDEVFHLGIRRKLQGRFRSS